MSSKQTADDIRVSVLTFDTVDEKQSTSEVLSTEFTSSSSSSSPPPTKFGVLWNTTWKKAILGVVMAGIVLTLGMLAGFGLLHSAEATAAAVGVVGSETLHSYPLAVKSPYLSAWLPSEHANNVPIGQPQFWAGQNLTWSVLARVNNATYTLFGAPHNISGAPAATQQQISYTSSHTLVNLTAGNANITLDFFSPVLLGENDLARQSLPYSYLTVSAISGDGNAADVQILSAIDSSWTAQNGTGQLNYTQTASSGYFQFYNTKQIPYTEERDMATYGSVVFASSINQSNTHQCDTPDNVYNSFISSGSLSGARGDDGNTSTGCLGSNLVGITGNLADVASDASSITYAIGFNRDLAINYLNQSQTGYYRSVWPTIEKQVDYFLTNYSTTLNQSNTFDETVRTKAKSVSSEFGENYADILEATIRQTFGAMEITIPANNLSDTSNPYIFLKEISSDGNMNTIDVIFPTFPILVSLNPTYLRLMLQPVMEYLALPVSSGGWPKPFVIHDIGSNYPNATGHADGREEDMPLFETSALFQLLYAYQKFTGDTAWAAQWSSLLNGYADYLVQHSLYPAVQLISVDAIRGTVNQTGLAVQSTIGLAAAAALLNNSTYRTTADSFVDQIYNQGLGLDGQTPETSTHFTYNYDHSTTWGTLFPIYPDVLLNLTTFPTAAYEMEASYLLTQNKPAGLPFFGPYDYTESLTDGGCAWTITDWTFWTSAAVDNVEFQGVVVNATKAFLTNGRAVGNNEPFGTKYEVIAPGTEGKWVGNRARSTVGANFALIALEQGVWSKLY